MAITATHLLTNAVTTNQTSYTTSASITPTANNLVLAWILSTKTASPSPAAPTLTGNGLTWVQVATVTFAMVSTGLYRLTLFRAMGASPTSGTVAISFAGVSQQGCGYAFSQFAGVDTSGTDGSGGVVRSTVANADNVTTLSSLSLASPAFEGTTNATAAGFGINLNSAITTKTGWTQLGTNIGYSNPTARIQSQWIAGNDTAPSATFPSGSEVGGIAVELRDAQAPRRAIVTWLELEVPAAPEGPPGEGPKTGSVMLMGMGR